MFKKKQEEPVISFVNTIPGLEIIDEIQVKPAQKFIPKWWKDIPNNKGKYDKVVTAKSCPSFPDYFSQGYIIPMWADTLIKYDKETEIWTVQCGRSNDFNWDFHGNDQLLDYVNPSLFGKNAHTVLKAISPWKIITKPGWSVMQVPLYYHFDNKFSVMPGIIHTDVHHDINQQVLVYDKDVEIFIKRGEPFVQYIPFKRENISCDVRYQTDFDRKKFIQSSMGILSKLIGNGGYNHKVKHSKLNP